MTDTRKEFEEWFWSAGIGGRGELIISEKSWQACKSLNDKRIQQLLAVIKVKDEALKLLLEFKGMIEERSGDYETNKASEAIAIKPGDVELVEIGKVSEVGGSLFASQYSPNHGVKVGEKLYKLQKKGN